MGKQFLVLELVEGETLAQRISRGPLPVDEAMEVCRQIAEGLEAAHEKGIIHRDLKPGNVKITPEGKVKILDFGLAKAFHDRASEVELRNSPTITANMTQPGIILGTAAYMSPEQAKGKAVDKRADIWAFGGILYECLTGKRPFEGDSLTDTLAKILECEPDWARLPAGTPPILRSLLRRCLQKDKNKRQRDMADVRIEIEEATGSLGENEQFLPAKSKSSKWLIPLIGISVAAGAILGGLAIWSVKRIPAPRQIVRFPLALPADQQFSVPYSDSLAISPDGTEIVYAANKRLYRRSLSSFESSPIRGTEGFGLFALNPFFSPDGQWVGFWADYKIFRVQLAGGNPLQVCACEYYPGRVVWGDDGLLTFYQGGQGISQVASAGGRPQVLITRDSAKGERLGWPQRIPGSEWIIFSSRPMDKSWRETKILAQSLKTNERKTLIEGGLQPLYVATGHLVYLQDQHLMAVPVDPVRAKIEGEPTMVVDGILQSGQNGVAQVTIADNGTLAYLPSSTEVALPKLVWVTRKGEVTEAIKDRQNFGYLNLSRDGRKVVLNIPGSEGDMEVWVYDLFGGTAPLRLTRSGCSWDPIWTPDGKSIVFDYAPTCGGDGDIYRLPIEGGTPELLLARPGPQYPVAFGRRGELFFVETQPSKGWDIAVVELKAKAEPRPLLDSEFNEMIPAVSPDGRWIAYQSNESGSPEIYVVSYPDLRGKKRVSSGGGDEPKWSPDGRRLYFKSGRDVMGLDVAPGPDFAFSEPKPLFSGNYWGFLQQAWPSYCVAPDGRFLMIEERAADSGLQINVVLNWFEDLKRLAPPGRK